MSSCSHTSAYMCRLLQYYIVERARGVHDVDDVDDDSVLCGGAVVLADNKYTACD